MNFICILYILEMLVHCKGHKCTRRPQHTSKCIEKQQVQQDLVLSMSPSQVLYERKQDLSHLFGGEALF